MILSIESKKIQLRFAQLGDENPLFSDYTGDLSSSKFLARKVHLSTDDTLKMLTSLSKESSFLNNGKCVLVICFSCSLKPIGLLTLVQTIEGVEIHFGIGKSFRNQGYAKAAILQAVDYIKNKIGTVLVFSFTDVENIPAQNALEKCGFILDNTLSSYYIAPQLGGTRRKTQRYKLNV